MQTSTSQYLVVVGECRMGKVQPGLLLAELGSTCGLACILPGPTRIRHAAGGLEEFTAGFGTRT